MKTCTSILEAQAVPGVTMIWAGPPVIAYEPGDVIPANHLPAPVDPKAVAWEAIKAHRDLLSDTGGYFVASVSKWFHSDEKSKTQQISLFIMGAAVPPVQWKTMDGSFVGMTQTLAAQIFQAAVSQDQAIFANAERHRLLMLASADSANYDFSGGWPAVFGG